MCCRHILENKNSMQLRTCCTRQRLVALLWETLLGEVSKTPSCAFRAAPLWFNTDIYVLHISLFQNKVVLVVIKKCNQKRVLVLNYFPAAQ